VKLLGFFFKIITKIPFVRKNTILKGIFDIFFEKPKFYGWGMRTMHENPWIDNFQESTFRKSCIDVKNFQFTMAGINKKTVDQLKWRHWIVAFATRYAIDFSSQESNNFVECGTADGITAFFILREIHSRPNFAKNFKMFCYDAWDKMESTSLSTTESKPIDYSVLNLDSTKENLIEFKDDLTFCKGYIPNSFELFPGPSSISFLHVDINSSKITLEILEYFFDKLTKNGVILFDDYGWSTYADTKNVVDEFFHKKSGTLLKLPTSQAIFFRSDQNVLKI
jgi:hypothetical protein